MRTASSYLIDPASLTTYNGSCHLRFPKYKDMKRWTYFETWQILRPSEKSLLV